MMGDKIVKLLIFGIGAAIGSVVTWKLVKTKYERIADEEIESVKKSTIIKRSLKNTQQSLKLRFKMLLKLSQRLTGIVSIIRS